MSKIPKSDNKIFNIYTKHNFSSVRIEKNQQTSDKKQTVLIVNRQHRRKGVQYHTIFSRVAEISSYIYRRTNTFTHILDINKARKSVSYKKTFIHIHPHMHPHLYKHTREWRKRTLIQKKRKAVVERVCATLWT